VQTRRANQFVRPSFLWNLDENKLRTEQIILITTSVLDRPRSESVRPSPTWEKEKLNMKELRGMLEWLKSVLSSFFSFYKQNYRKILFLLTSSLLFFFLSNFKALHVLNYLTPLFVINKNSLYCQKQEYLINFVVNSIDDL